MKFLKINGFILLAAISCFGQNITKDEFIEKLMATHPGFAAEKLSAQVEQAERSSLLGDQDWRFSSSFRFEHDEPEIAFAGPDRTDALILEGELKRTFWETGGTLSLAYKSSFADINLPVNTPFPASFYQNRIALTYKHPLLKNKAGFLNKLQYDLKKFDLDISEIRAKENTENFLTTAISRFYEWVFYEEQLEIIKARLRLSEEELFRVKKKRHSNLVDQADVIRAQDAVYQWRQNCAMAETQRTSTQAELAELLQDEQIKELKPTFDLFATVQIKSFTHVKQELVEGARLLRMFDTHLQKNKHLQHAYEEEAKADLSLFTQLNTKNLDRDFMRSFGMDKPSAIIGVQLNMTLNNHGAKLKIKKNKLQTLQLNRRRDDLLLNLSSALANLHTRILQSVHILELDRVQITSTQLRTKEELELYNQGRGDLTFVIQSRDNEQNARLSHARNALVYHMQLLEYHALLDRIYN